jgi:hypothetical protein
MLARCQPVLNAMMFVRNIKKINFDMRPALALFPDFDLIQPHKSRCLIPDLANGMAYGRHRQTSRPA